MALRPTFGCAPGTAASICCNVRIQKICLLNDPFGERGTVGISKPTALAANRSKFGRRAGKAWSAATRLRNLGVNPNMRPPVLYVESTCGMS